MSVYWDLPLMIAVVSLVYSATRHDRWDLILREALQWGKRIVVFLGGIGLALFALSTWI
jgi:hypothetical protein